MLEFLLIACAAAIVGDLGCPPSLDESATPQKRVERFEQQVAADAWQLSYAGDQESTVADMTALWHRRAATLCSGAYRGAPVSQILHPGVGDDSIPALLPLLRIERHRVEAFGVAHCAVGTY